MFTITNCLVGKMSESCWKVVGKIIIDNENCEKIFTFFVNCFTKFENSFTKFDKRKKLRPNV